MSQDETRHSCGWYSVTQLLGLCIYSSRRMRSTLCCRINGPVKLGLGGTEQCKHLPLGETPFFTTELGVSAFYNILEASKILFCKNACSIFVISTETGRSGTVEGGGQRPCPDLDDEKWKWRQGSERQLASASFSHPFLPPGVFFFFFFFLHFWLKLEVNEWTNYSEGVLRGFLWTLTLLCFSSSADVFDPEFATHCMYLWNFCSRASF